MAEIAVHTLDLDRLAAELAARVDYQSWADRLAPAITAPTPPPADEGTDSPAAPNPASNEAALAQPHQPPAPHNPDTDTDAALAAGPEAAPHPDPEPDPPGHDDRDEEGEEDDDQDDDEEFDADDDVELAPDLVPLLPAARAARAELLGAGRTVSRDSLAHRLRRNGHAIRNNRVSELLNALRREEAALNGARPKVPA